MSAPKLSADQARKLHDADVAAKKLRAALKAAEAHNTEMRARYLDRVPLSADPDEAAEGIRVTRVGGVDIRICPQTSGDRFSLTTYVATGYEITPEMQEAITPGKPWNRWTLKPAAGPKKLKAVEPS